MSQTNPMREIKEQQTFCMIKQDGVMRGLVGEIVLRIERAGLKVVAMKMLVATPEQVENHYPIEDLASVERIGQKGLGTFKDLNLDPKQHLGSDDPKVIGQTVVQSLVGYMTSGPVVCIVVQGVQAIDMVRKLAGHTIPAKADVGTVRGDFSVDSPAVANVEMRALHNLMHASETLEEASTEIGLWFTPTEIHSYGRTGEDIMFSKTY